LNLFTSRGECLILNVKGQEEASGGMIFKAQSIDLTLYKDFQAFEDKGKGPDNFKNNEDIFVSDEALLGAPGGSILQKGRNALLTEIVTATKEINVVGADGKPTGKKETLPKYTFSGNVGTVSFQDAEIIA